MPPDTGFWNDRSTTICSGVVYDSHAQADPRAALANLAVPAAGRTGNSELVEAAVAAKEIRADVDADELLGAVASLCMSAHNAGPGRAERMVALLLDGLRFGVDASKNAPF
jgi:hypothetical protein